MEINPAKNDVNTKYCFSSMGRTNVGCGEILQISSIILIYVMLFIIMIWNRWQPGATLLTWFNFNLSMDK